MKDSTGPACTPTKPSSQPHWKIATITPSEAVMLSRFMIAACRGITSERNTTISSSADSATTTPMKSGSLWLSTEAKSTEPAVTPPTYTVIAAREASGGITLLRSRETSCVVAKACGEERG